MLAIVAPGQGAQSPGFLEPWLEIPSFADGLSRLSEVTGLDLAHYGTAADADTIRDTAVAQPLLVASALLTAWEVVPGDGLARATGVLAGHSVGELAAAALSGSVTAQEAMVLVRERGRAMATAAAATPTSMTAILGGDREDVLAALEQHGLTPANDNGPGQIVAAGTVEQLAALTASPPARARLAPLSVAGAFHTHHMSAAVEVLDDLAGSISASDPQVPVISNRDGAVVRGGREILDRIVTQIGAPVRWDLCMSTMLDLGTSGMMELAPGGVLTGIARRAMKGVETFALKTPDQLEDARAFAEKHRADQDKADQDKADQDKADQDKEVTA